MKKEYRIKKTSEIDAIFKNRKSRNNQYYGIHQKRNENNEHFRFALSIGKKYGNAVERNLAKRRIRAVVLECSKSFNKKSDFVIVIKPASNQLKFQELRTSLIDLFIISRIMENKHEKH